MKKKLINICGTGRSGSTMVDLMLGNDKKAFSLGEVSAWFRPFRTHHFRILCSCKQYNCPWNYLKNLKEKDFYIRCFDILNVDTLVDSSKNISWVIDNNLDVIKYDISVYNILLYKDPVNFFYSFWKRGIPADEKLRYRYINYYQRFFETNLPFISLNYNKLVNDPKTTLKKLCQTLEIPYFEGKENFWEIQHHHLFGSRGTRKQAIDSKSEIRKKEHYPSEFKKIISKIEKENLKNELFQSILSKLKANEMKKENFNLSIKVIHKPYWYYLSKLKQKFLQKFPQKWEYDH